MKRIILCMFALMAMLSANAITVTITVDEGFDNPAILQKMEANLGQVLTEINEAYYGKRAQLTIVGIAGLWRNVGTTEMMQYRLFL